MQNPPWTWPGSLSYGQLATGRKQQKDDNGLSSLTTEPAALLGMSINTTIHDPSFPWMYYYSNLVAELCVFGEFIHSSSDSPGLHAMNGIFGIMP